MLPRKRDLLKLQTPTLSMEEKKALVIDLIKSRIKVWVDHFYYNKGKFSTSEDQWSKDYHRNGMVEAKNEIHKLKQVLKDFGI